HASWLLEKHTDFVESFASYKSTLEKAPAAFRQLATLYEKYSKEETEPFFQREYGEMAKRTRAIASAMEDRLKLAETGYGSVERKVHFVRRSQVFLTRIEGFLSVLESVTGPQE